MNEQLNRTLKAHKHEARVKCFIRQSGCAIVYITESNEAIKETLCRMLQVEPYNLQIVADIN